MTGCIATIKTSSDGLDLLQSNFLVILIVSSAIVRYSSSKEVSAPASSTIFSGNPQKSQDIDTSRELENILQSDESILTTSLLKNISNASRTVDLPTSFRPTIVVKSSNAIVTGDL